jgi:protein ImuB
LFLPQAPQPEKLELVLARLAAAGANAGSPQILDTHRPGAFRMTRFAPDYSPRRHGDTEDFQVSGVGQQASDPGNLKPDTRDLIPTTSVSPRLRGEAKARAPLLALRLFRPPRAAFVQWRDGRPQHVSCAGIRGPVVWRAGPWRSSGDWWQQAESADDASSAVSSSSADTASWAREEWDVALQQDETGLALYRIFRDLIQGKWFVEGEYD